MRSLSKFKAYLVPNFLYVNVITPNDSVLFLLLGRLPRHVY